MGKTISAKSLRKDIYKYLVLTQAGNMIYIPVKKDRVKATKVKAIKLLLKNGFTGTEIHRITGLYPYQAGVN